MTDRSVSDKVVQDVVDELNRAMAKHGPMLTYHDGYAVILEELDELWDEVKLKHPDPAKLREEAIQVAAMAMRFVMDVLNG